MAYLDARHTQRNVGTFAVVTVLETGLVLAVIAGLSYKYSTRPETRIEATQLTLPPLPDEKKDPIVKPPVTPQVIERPQIIRDPVIELGPGPKPFSGEDEGGGLGLVTFPTPIASPAPSFSPIKAKPRGNPANWVTPNDYPASEIRAERQGRTAFRVSVDAMGKASDCTVTGSSGSPVLDATTCEKLMRRSRFEAAIDSTGARTEGVYVGSVNWRLPEE